MRRRRIALAIGLALAAAGAWAAAPALSLNPYVPRVVEFGMNVRTPAAARAAAGPATTGVLHAGRRFDLFGLTWNGPVYAHVEVRARMASGRWTGWQAGDPAVDVPDLGSPVRGTEPIWVGGADALQLRLPASVSDVHVEFTCDGKPAAVRADSAQLRQLVWNLVRNAVQASEAGEVVTVSVKNFSR